MRRSQLLEFARWTYSLDADQFGAIFSDEHGHYWKKLLGLDRDFLRFFAELDEDSQQAMLNAFHDATGE